jgi:hypothetical protein
MVILLRFPSRAFGCGPYVHKTGNKQTSAEDSECEHERFHVATTTRQAATMTALRLARSKK